MYTGQEPSAACTVRPGGSDHCPCSQVHPPVNMAVTTAAVTANTAGTQYAGLRMWEGRLGRRAGMGGIGLLPVGARPGPGLAPCCGPVCPTMSAPPKNVSDRVDDLSAPRSFANTACQLPRLGTARKAERRSARRRMLD